MILEKHKCLFVHIPKTAGQSIENYFLNLDGLNWGKRASLLLRRNNDRKKGPERLAHLTAEEYLDYDYLSENDFSNFFKFTFVRNPWARLVSEYRYRNLDRKVEFKKFVMSGLPEEDYYSDSYRHVMPQYRFIFSANMELLVDFVGKFENLQEDFNLACSRIGVSQGHIPHIVSTGRFKRLLNKIFTPVLPNNKLSKTDYRSFYDNDLKAYVEEMYKKDVSLFDYRF